jgi:hypothetical protein
MFIYPDANFMLLFLCGHRARTEKQRIIREKVITTLLSKDNPEKISRSKSSVCQLTSGQWTVDIGHSLKKQRILCFNQT